MTPQPTIPGVVVLHASNDVPAARQAMLQNPDDPNGAVVAIDVDPLPAATDLHDVICEAVSTAAAKVWPGRYSDILSMTLDKGLTTDAVLNSAIASAGLGGRVSAAWLRGAASLVAVGRPPLPPHTTLHEMLIPLACMFGTAPVLLVCMTAVEPPGERLDALGRMLAGIAAQTPFRVHLIVPTDVASSMELDQVNYVTASTSTIDRSQRIFDPSKETVIAPAPAALTSFPMAAADEPASSVSAMVGKPHPESPGEQKLADWLANDTMLCGLFQFNQALRTTRHSTYRVDLLWAEGRVVVEVDGYRNHSTPHQFRFDRHRDYELALTGYLVLRLTHQEVMQDVGLAIEKIRDVVRIREPGRPRRAATNTFIQENVDEC